MSTLRLASGHVQSRDQSIDGSHRQLSTTEKVSLYFATHARTLVLSSADRSFQGLWLLLQPSLSFPQTPCLHVKFFVVYSLHTERCGHSSSIDLQTAGSEYALLFFWMKPASLTALRCASSRLNWFLLSRAFAVLSLGFSFS